ncbi:deleted in azoospermia-like isoform X2 [Polypterus senegalus]|uniref:deleted in azoospermia-like isoform X2 n=1 Tax=Polypterus senegalus TaxID=55291 RepID=UPI0019644BD5|nr:deleted in azoospermia-like isoform X2 [Polypterus senegalus]XP_039593209.1 deleted in azoospermia-like isoform X2 [Polypterus senegalus]
MFHQHGFVEQASQTSPCTKMANGYVLPEGRITPNTIFVGGIDMKVDENEIKDFFSRYGTVHEVKIITYRGGICKGYGFVSFKEEVDIQAIVEQPIIFKGRKLKLGPAIMKARISCPSTSPGCSPHWMTSPPQQMHYLHKVDNIIPPTVIHNTGNPYVQPYHYPGVPTFVMPTNIPQPVYTFQYAAPHWTVGDHRVRLGNQNFTDTWCTDMVDPFIKSFGELFLG